MDSKFWKQRWETGQTAFHLDAPHPKLVQFASKLPAGKVMVPLCGKSNDLAWLRSQGHEVVGIELSAIACEAFFTEHQVSFERRSVGSAEVYEGGGITLWCGDFFDVPSSAWEGCTALYDRAALIALPEELRAKYARHIVKSWKLTSISSMLLISIEYPSEEPIGPPFSVVESEVRSLYEKSFEIERLSSQREEELSNRGGKFTRIDVTEKVFLLTGKR